MKKLIITILGILILGTGIIEAAVPGPGHPRKARHARHEIRKDKARIQHNLKKGNKRAAYRNMKKLKHDKRQLRHARMHNHR